MFGPLVDEPGSSTPRTFECAYVGQLNVKPNNIIELRAAHLCLIQLQVVQV